MTIELTDGTRLISTDHTVWTEEEYLALGETDEHIELFDGKLYVSPPVLPIHQGLSLQLAMSFYGVSKAAGFGVYQEVGVRLKTGSIAIPDLVIVDNIDPRELIVEASSVRLVCEVTSPSNAKHDRVRKMRSYAEVGIPWYLIVEPRPDISLHLFRLEGDHYLRQGEGRAGHPLRLTEPITVNLDPATLDG